MSYFQNSRRHIVDQELVDKGTFQPTDLGKIYHQAAIIYEEGDKKKVDVVFILHEEITSIENDYRFSSCHNGIVILKPKLS